MRDFRGLAILVSLTGALLLHSCSSVHYAKRPIDGFGEFKLGMPLDSLTVAPVNDRTFQADGKGFYECTLPKDLVPAVPTTVAGSGIVLTFADEILVGIMVTSTDRYIYNTMESEYGPPSKKEPVWTWIDEDRRAVSISSPPFDSDWRLIKYTLSYKE